MAVAFKSPMLIQFKINTADQVIDQHQNLSHTYIEEIAFTRSMLIVNAYCITFSSHSNAAISIAKKNKLNIKNIFSKIPLDAGKITYAKECSTDQSVFKLDEGDMLQIKITERAVTTVNVMAIPLPIRLAL